MRATEHFVLCSSRSGASDVAAISGNDTVLVFALVPAPMIDSVAPSHAVLPRVPMVASVPRFRGEAVTGGNVEFLRAIPHLWPKR